VGLGPSTATTPHALPSFCLPTLRNRAPVLQQQMLGALPETALTGVCRTGPP
jgi:hypothetical protein